MTPKATAIILARAGSKGLPGKNHAIIADKPCIQWTIDAAKAAQSIKHIIVSTDDPEVINIANASGCTVVERPKNLAHDTATIDSAARHAYEQIGSPIFQQNAPIVILYANVPVRPDWLIDQAINLLIKTNCHSVQSYTNVGKHHPWWTVKLSDDGTVAPWQGDTLYHNTFRRQDLPSAQVPDGGVIALTPNALMQQLDAPQGPHAFLGTDRRGIITSQGEVIDIDTRIDQLVADAVLKERLTTEGTEITEKNKNGVKKERDGEDADLTHKIIGCAMRVHQELGPGLLESVYEVCLLDELRNSGIQATNQVQMDVKYKDLVVRSGLRIDLLVEDCVVLEIKAVESLKKVHQAQLLTYMKLSNCKVGLLINFNQTTLKSGLKRMVL